MTRPSSLPIRYSSKVAKVAKEGDNVGKPAAATDVEGDSLRYSLSFSPEF